MSKSPNQVNAGVPSWDAIFLIHGVGNPDPEASKAALLGAGVPIGIDEDSIHDLNWNTFVENPVERSRVDHGQLSRLARSIFAASLAGIGPTKPGVGGFVARLQLYAADSLRVVSAFAPVLAMWAVLCLVWRSVHLDVGTPWVGPRFEPFAYPGWWTGTLFITYPLQIGKWASAWQLTAALWWKVVLGLALVVFALGVFRGGVRFLWPSLRLAALSVIAPAIYTVGLPFVFRLVASLGLAASLILSTVVGVPQYRTEYLSSVSVRFEADASLTSYVAWADAGRILAVVAILLFIGLVLLALLRPGLKVTADIFRYLGSASYRTALRNGLRDRIASVVQGRTDVDVILAGHSLGSVIAFDLLRHPDNPLREARRVRLLTGGSPLRRIFHRFFPSWYPHPVVGAAQLGEAQTDFAWINVFRPLDYMGRSLGARRESPIRNRRVPQRRRLHVGYWSDPLVISAAKEELMATLVEPAAPSGSSGAFEPPTPPPDTDNEPGLYPFWILLPVAFGLMNALAFTALEANRSQSLFQDQRAALQAEGDTAEARIYRVQREMWEESEYGSYIVEYREYWVRFPVPGRIEPVEARLDLRFHDEKAIEDRFNAYLSTDPPAAADQVGTPTSVEFLRGDPTRVHAPEFAEVPGVSFGRLVGGAVQFVLGLLFGLLPAAMLGAQLARRGQ